MATIENEQKCKLSRDVKVLPSMCSGDSKLSLAAALDIFQDTASMHADTLDIGPAGMERRKCFWIISKTRMHINRIPDMMENVTSSTWVQAHEKVSCERDYSITSGDETLVYGRSIWAVISRETGKLVKLEVLYPDIEFDIAPPDDKPFLRMSRKFDVAEPIGKYSVRSVDIDLGGHMNNVNYIRAMLGCFSSEQLEAMDITELEVNFLSQTYEGETLTFLKRESETGLEIGAVNEEGATVFLAAIS